MKLYHVTNNLLHNGIFLPRIPSRRVFGENETIERICMSSSIEGCLTAIPGGGVDLNEYLGETNCILRVFELNMREQYADGCYFPDELKKKGLVPDAHITDEHWITDVFIADKSYLIQVSDYTFGRMPPISDNERKMYPNGIPFIEDITYTSSSDELATVHLPYPGDEEWKTFLRLGRAITGKDLRKRRDDRYSTEKCGEEFFFLAANFGNGRTYPFKASLGQCATFPMTNTESYKLWHDMIIYRDYI